MGGLLGWLAVAGAVLFPGAIAVQHGHMLYGSCTPDLSLGAIMLTGPFLLGIAGVGWCLAQWTGEGRKSARWCMILVAAFFLGALFVVLALPSVTLRMINLGWIE